jgi:hypothetical protein
MDTFFIPSYTPVLIKNLDIPNTQLQKYIKEIYSLGDSQNQKTNVKAIMSSYEIWTETQILNPLFNHIGDLLYDFLITKYYHPDDTNDIKMLLKNAWSAIYKKEHYTIPHSHGLSDWSFVFYLQSTGSTPLVFEDSNKKFYLKTNDLIIFPGNLNHSVPKHNEEEDRICLAGNFTIKK